MAKLQVSIFHYHLLPGGVTDVIMGWLRIFASHSQSIFPQYRKIALRVCCGRPDNIAKLKRRWQNLQQSDTANPLTISVEFLVDQELNYRGLPDNRAFAELSPEQQTLSWQGYVQSLAAHLLHNYAQETQNDQDDQGDQEGWDHLWWIHNFHLGKNIAYTKALIQIIQGQFSAAELATKVESGNPAPSRLKFLLHIHDFPECGRFERYSELLQSQIWLDRCASADPADPAVLAGETQLARLYPLSPHVCYATINQRDYKILKDSGIAEQRLFFLPNPLEFRDLSGSDGKGDAASAEQLQQQLNRKLGLQNKPIALYPVRCIRRKNVLELALLNILARERWNLLCTLPGLSEHERPYSDLIEDLYREGLIQGRCHVGLELDSLGFSFDNLCRAASLIGSSSIMEGFGFTYFNPMYWGKALLARHLDVLQGFGHCFQPQLSLFYHKLQIPLCASDPDLQAMYRELRQKYYSYVEQLPPAIRSIMSVELQQHLGEEIPEGLDFACFTVTQQLQLLRRLKSQQPDDREFAAACCQANAQLLQQVDELPTLTDQSAELAAARSQSRNQVHSEFAPQSLAQILGRACTSIFSPEAETAAQNADPPNLAASMEDRSRKVLQSYSKLEYNYAILWDKSWQEKD